MSSVSFSTRRRGPERLTVVVVDAMPEVEDETGRCPLREGVAVYTHSLCSRELSTHVVVAERHFVIARTCHFGVVAEAGAIAAVRMGSSAGVQQERTGGGHDEQVSQVGMSCSAEVGVAESHNGSVAVLVPCAVLVHVGLIDAIHVVGNGVGVGAEPDDAEGYTCSGEGMPHAVGADEWIDVFNL